MRSAIDNVRLQIIGENVDKSNTIITPKQVKDEYQKLITTNSINGSEPILPDITIKALPGSKKLWQDELRFIVHAAFQEIRDMPTYNEYEFVKITQFLRDHFPGNNYSDESLLSNLDILRKNVDPQPEVQLLTKFINSTDFLYVPVSSEKVGGAWEIFPSPMVMMRL